MAMSGMVSVLAASYEDVDDARADLEAVKAAFRHVGTSLDLDAAVIARDDSGKVEIVDRHDERTHDRKVMGLGWGLAVGAVAALFPPIGIVGAMAVGGGAGAALGASAGHAARAMSRDDLKELGEVLDRGDAGLIVVHGSEMSDRMASTTTRAKAKVWRSTDLSFEQLVGEVRAAEEAVAAP
jgi:uncharacterized membrane protein